MDKEVSLESSEEAELLVGWAWKFGLMYLQREICLKINALKREWDQERLSLKEGSSFQALIQRNNSTAQLQQSKDRKTSLHLHPLKNIKNWSVK